MILKKISLPIVLIVLLISCGQTTETDQPLTETDVLPGTLRGQVEYYIDKDRYEEALALLVDADITNDEIIQLLLASHMTYAIWLTYQSDHDMRERMPQALRHYRRVLELDPNNARATAEIAQIEGIYNSLNRPVPQGVAEP